MGDEKRKRFDLGDVAVCMIIGGFIIMILSLIFSSPFMVKLGLVIAIVGIAMIFLERKSDTDSHIANRNAFQEEYDEYIGKIGIVKSDTQATLFERRDSGFEAKVPQYLWIVNDNLNIFPMAKYYKEERISSISKPDVSSLKLKSIPVDSIMYFEEIGELRKYATVSGGGTSLKGALLGYAIADDLGAVIGSREPVKTTIVSEDDRRVELIYKDKDGNIENLEFTYDAYKVLKSLIPSKELRRMINLRSSQDDFSSKIQDESSTKDKLKQLHEMKAEGLITEDEFLEQKRKILGAF